MDNAQGVAHEERKADKAADGVAGEAEHEGLSAIGMGKYAEPDGLAGLEIDFVEDLAYSKIRVRVSAGTSP